MSLFSSLIHSDKLTWLLGLAIAFVVFLPVIVSYRRRLVVSSVVDGAQLSPKEIRVSQIFIHPIKSCRGIAVQSARYTPEGLQNDRKWCIIDAETKSVITGREVSKMVLITPTIEADEDSAFGGVLRVSFPVDSGCESFVIPLRPTPEMLNKWDFVDVNLFKNQLDGYICESLTTGRSPSAILSTFFDKPVHLIYKGPRRRICQPALSFPQLEASTNFPNTFPLLVLSEESVESVQQEVRASVGKQGVDEHWKTDILEIRRFRPNIVLKGGDAFYEDVLEEISIGSQTSNFLLVNKCPRCSLTNVSTETGIRDQAVPYKVMIKTRAIDPRYKARPVLGNHSVPLGAGEIKIGDVVSVIRETQ